MVDFARPPKALQAPACSEASDPLRVNCWIFARRWQGKSNIASDRSSVFNKLSDATCQ